MKSNDEKNDNEKHNIENIISIEKNNRKLKTQREIDLTIYDENNLINVFSKKNKKNEKNENMNYDNIILFDVVDQKSKKKIVWEKVLLFWFATLVVILHLFFVLSSR